LQIAVKLKPAIFQPVFPGVTRLTEVKKRKKVAHQAERRHRIKRKNVMVKRFVCRVWIQHAIPDGKEPDGLSLKKLRNDQPVELSKQEKLIQRLYLCVSYATFYGDKKEGEIMELLYFRTGKFGCLKNMGFNFGGKYFFELKNYNCELWATKNEKFIENFFDDNGSITSLSAVVGANGSGKSHLIHSFLKIVKDESLRYENPRYDFIVVFRDEKENKNYVYDGNSLNHDNGYKGDLGYLDYTPINFEQFKEKIQIVFYSPAVDGQYEYSDINNVINISTCYLMFVDDQKDIKDQLGVLGKKVTDNQNLPASNIIHKYRENIRILKFITSESFQEFQELLGLPNITKITITHSNNQQISVKSNEFPGNLSGYGSFEVPGSQKIKGTFSRVDSNPKFYDGLNEIAKQLKNNPFSFDVVDINDFSSGEIAFIKLFSRIYDIKDRVQNDNLLLFLDEPELYMHPQWQKQLPNCLIKMSRQFFHGKKIQIIFTTNNPLMLSDLPTHNIVYLEKEQKDGDGGRGVISVKRIDDQRTFGASVTKILADSFFLQGGIIGEFAKEKIDDIIRLLDFESDDKAKINMFKKNQDRVKRTISLIGEPVIRRHLEQKFHEAVTYADFQQEIEHRDRHHSIDRKIKKLENELESLRKQQRKNSNTGDEK
jgi:predicted ATPase